MVFNPYQFKALAQVVRDGSFSAAARTMGVSQSAVTQHISKLEATVGVRLLVRDREGLHLTTTGQEFFELADRYATLDALAEEKLRGYTELTKGHLRFIANAPQPALRLIARYAKAYPDVGIDFSLVDWSRAMDMLQSHQTDIAIVTDPTLRKDWHRVKISTARYVLYLLQDHPLATQKEVSLKDVVSETLLLPETGSLTQRIVSLAFAKHKLTPKRIIKTTTFPVMKETILEGLGVGIFLENSAQKTAHLVERPIQELTHRHETCLVIPNHKLDLRLTQSFLSFV